LDPEHIDAWTNLGILLSGSARTEQAAVCYCKVITLRPKHREARKLLGTGALRSGRDRQGGGDLQQWLEEEPDNPIARHMLAACNGEAVPVRASDGFCRDDLRQFGGEF